jgi:hypothetical protein
MSTVMDKSGLAQRKIGSIKKLMNWFLILLLNLTFDSLKQYSFVK